MNKLSTAFCKIAKIPRRTIILFSELASFLVYLGRKAVFRGRLPQLEPQYKIITGEIQNQGACKTSLAHLDLPLNQKLVKAASYLVSEFDLNSAALSLTSDRVAASSHRAFIDPMNIARDFPEILQWGLQQPILDLVDNIIGVPSTFVGLILRKEILNEQQIGTRLWHLDGEDHNTVKILVYLNDVELENGAFEYIPTSAAPFYLSFPGLNLLNFAYSDRQMAKLIPASRWQACTGKAGTVIIANTSKVFHHGRVPQKDRYVLIYSYTSRQPKRPSLCRQETFRVALPHIENVLEPHQKESIYDYAMMSASREQQ